MPNQILSKAARVIFASILFGSIFMPRLSVWLPGSVFSVDIRIEDVLLPVFILLVFLQGSENPRRLSFSGIENRFLVFFIVCGLSVLNGFVLGTIDKPFASFFCLLKWFEYFLFFAVSIRFFSRTPPGFYLKLFFCLGMTLTLYGYIEHFFPTAKAVYPNYYRIFERAPFYGDANHMGGLLAFWIAFFTGYLIETRDSVKKVFLGAGVLTAFFPLIWTYSRKSYLALAGCYFLALLWGGKRKQLLFVSSVLIIAAVLLPTRFSERMLDIGESFSSADPFHTSWAGDVTVWKRSFVNFKKMFLLGSGWGSRHRRFYESQYVQILTESGVIGFALFLSLLWALGCRIGLARSQLSADQQELRAGWLMAFIAFIIHSLTCVSFTVVKLALPFWFTTAFVLTELAGRGQDDN